MTDSTFSPSREWPTWPNFDQFKHQAKDVLKAYRAGEADTGRGEGPLIQPPHQHWYEFARLLLEAGADPRRPLSMSGAVTGSYLRRYG